MIEIEERSWIDQMRIVFRDNQQSILEDAAGKLEEIRHNKWKEIARELAGEDPYQFLRAYSPGKDLYYLATMDNSCQKAALLMVSILKFTAPATHLLIFKCSVT